MQLRADNILQELAIYYDAPNDPGNPIAYEPGPNTLEKLISRYENLNNTGSGVGTDTWRNINDVFEPLKNLLNTKQHYALLIPTALDSAINNFVKSVTTSIDMDLAQAETKKKLGEGEQDSVRKQRWADIFIAYRELKDHLRATLGLDLTPVNIRGM